MITTASQICSCFCLGFIRISRVNKIYESILKRCLNKIVFISRVWPRASAVAEKLWSPETSLFDIPDSVYHRLEEHTCRMNRRGIRAQPPNGPGFCPGADLVVAEAA